MTIKRKEKKYWMISDDLKEELIAIVEEMLKEGYKYEKIMLLLSRVHDIDIDELCGMMKGTDYQIINETLYPSTKDFEIRALAKILKNSVIKCNMSVVDVIGYIIETDSNNRKKITETLFKMFQDRVWFHLYGKYIEENLLQHGYHKLVKRLKGNTKRYIAENPGISFEEWSNSKIIYATKG